MIRREILRLAGVDVDNLTAISIDRHDLRRVGDTIISSPGVVFRLGALSYFRDGDVVDVDSIHGIDGCLGLWTKHIAYGFVGVGDDSRLVGVRRNPPDDVP